jgi:ankyrin repeat protein
LVGNLEDVKLLLELGADPNASVDKKFGSMPLITAVRHNHVEIVKELMKAAPEQKNHVDIKDLQNGSERQNCQSDTGRRQ